MLILTRRINENIIIDNDIIVTILGIRGDQIKLGITAPTEISVNREEVYNRICAEKIDQVENTYLNIDKKMTKKDIRNERIKNNSGKGYIKTALKKYYVGERICWS